MDDRARARFEKSAWEFEIRFNTCMNPLLYVVSRSTPDRKRQDEELCEGRIGREERVDLRANFGRRYRRNAGLGFDEGQKKKEKLTAEVRAMDIG